MKEVKKRRSAPSRETVQTAHGARRRKRKKRSYTLYYLLLLFFVLVSGITLSLTVFFNIESITVTGSKLHQSETVIEKSGIKLGDNLFRTDIHKAEEQLISAFGDIDAAKITRKFPNSLTIELTDAEPAYYMADEGGYTVLSKGGRILFKHLPKEELPGGVCVKGIDTEKMKLGSYIDSDKDEKLDLLEQLDMAIQAAKLTDISYIDVENSVELSLCYQDRLIIKLGSPSELTYKLNFARNIIETKLAETDTGVIDTTHIGKLHFTPNELSSAATASTASGTTSDVASEAVSGTSSVSSAFASSANSKESSAILTSQAVE